MKKKFTKIVMDAGGSSFPYHIFSAKARMMLIKMKSKLIELIPWDKWADRHYYSSQTWDKVFTELYEDGYYVQGYSGILYKDGMVYDVKDQFSGGTRTHRDLIRVVEELGKEASRESNLVIWKVFTEWNIYHTDNEDMEILDFENKIVKTLPEQIEEIKEEIASFACEVDYRIEKIQKLEEEIKKLEVKKDSELCQKS